jgi:hypothetical protein
MPRAKRQPPRAVKNGVRVKSESPAKPVVSAALKTAIDTMDHMRLRLLVKNYCETMQPLREDLEKSLLVPGRKVIRYHADSESEDREEEEEGIDNGDESDQDGAEIEKVEKPVHHISIGDEELTPRFVTCVNCNEEFDISANEKGECAWHPG